MKLSDRVGQGRPRSSLGVARTHSYDLVIAHTLAREPPCPHAEDNRTPCLARCSPEHVTRTMPRVERCGSGGRTCLLAHWDSHKCAHTQNSCMREPPMAQGNQVAPHWIQLHTRKRLPKSTEQGLRQTPDQSSKRQDSQAGAPCMANGVIAFTVRTHARTHTRRTQKHTWRCMVGMREAGRSHSKRARPGTRTIQRWWLSTQWRPSLDEVRLRLFHQTYNAYVASAWPAERECAKRCRRTQKDCSNRRASVIEHRRHCRPSAHDGTLRRAHPEEPQAENGKHTPQRRTHMLLCLTTRMLREQNMS